MNELVKVYKSKSENNLEEEETFGHIVYETEKTFKVHSSNKRFSKKTYHYVKIIDLEKETTNDE